MLACIAYVLFVSSAAVGDIEEFQKSFFLNSDVEEIVREVALESERFWGEKNGEVCERLKGCIPGPPYDGLHYKKSLVQKDGLIDGTFISLSGLTVATAIIDLKTAYNAIESGAAKEGNPLMRLMMKLGKPGAYAVVVGLKASLLWGSYKLRERGSELWWLLPAISISSNSIGVAINLSH